MDFAPVVTTRRRFLSAIAVAGTGLTAGCPAIWDQPGATDVLVYNLASETKVVSITVTDPDGDGSPYTDRTLELEPTEKVDPVNRGKIPLSTAWTVEVTVEGGPSETFDWDDPDVRYAPLWIIVDDSRNIRFLLEAG